MSYATPATGASIGEAPTAGQAPTGVAFTRSAGGVGRGPDGQGATPTPTASATRHAASARRAAIATSTPRCRNAQAAARAAPPAPRINARDPDGAAARRSIGARKPATSKFRPSHPASDRFKVLTAPIDAVVESVDTHRAASAPLRGAVTLRSEERRVG